MWPERNKTDAAEVASLDTLQQSFWRRFTRHLCLRRNRKSDDKQRTSFGTITAGNLAMMLLDDSIARAQAETSALPYGLGCVERLKYPLWFLQTGTGIRKFHG
jgi:hypothetical protein